MKLDARSRSFRLDIERISGDTLELDLEPTLNLLVGENATNRSSVIQSLRAHE